MSRASEAPAPQGGALNPPWPEHRLSAVEDAGLNASAPPQQLWLDGWLLRLCPGKAKRARCVNALAAGRRSLDERLTRAQSMFDAAGLELVVRITPFTTPQTLDADLGERGFQRFDDTHVLVAELASMALGHPLPAGLSLHPAAATDYAAIVGELRSSPETQRQAHALRMQQSPVPYQGWVLRQGDRVVACGQVAREAEHVGLYDVFTAAEARNQGLSTALCAALLQRARHDGASRAYLQVDTANAAALRVYRRLGFVDGYRYHYRARHPERA